MPKTFLAFHRFVASYLASDAGRDAPNSVARALLALDPQVCGFKRHPNLDRLHEFRLLIEDVHDLREPLYDGDAGLPDDTGVWSAAANPIVRQRAG